MSRSIKEYMVKQHKTDDSADFPGTIGEVKPELKLALKEVYGRSLYYPQCNLSGAITSCTGKKTLTPEHKRVLENAGFKIVLI